MDVNTNFTGISLIQGGKNEIKAVKKAISSASRLYYFAKPGNFDGIVASTGFDSTIHKEFGSVNLLTGKGMRSLKMSNFLVKAKILKRAVTEYSASDVLKAIKENSFNFETLTILNK